MPARSDWVGPGARGGRNYGRPPHAVAGTADLLQGRREERRGEGAHRDLRLRGPCALVAVDRPRRFE